MKKIIIGIFLLVILPLAGCGGAPASVPDTAPVPVPELAQEPILEPEPVQEPTATFAISDLVIFPTEVKPDYAMLISAVVTNDADLAGYCKVIFRIDNEVIQIKGVTLDGGVSQKVELLLKVNCDPGTHSVDVIIDPGVGKYSLDGICLSGTFTSEGEAIQVAPTPIPFQDNSYTIRVTGNPFSERETEFSGSYMVVTSDGNSTSRTVDGTTPAEYQVRGMIVSCVFQNQNDYGSLKVEILYEGTVVNYSHTTADFGVVYVATN